MTGNLTLGTHFNKDIVRMGSIVYVRKEGRRREGRQGKDYKEWKSSELF